MIEPPTPGTPPSPALSIGGVTISFGGVKAVNGLSLDVPSGAVFSIIGPNGAGKTTLLNAVSGFVRCRTGAIRYQGRDLVKLPAWRRSEIGIGRTFQNIHLFGSLSVLDNVMVGSHTRLRSGLPSAILHWGWARRDESRVRALSMELLQRFDLATRAHRPASSLPLAHQKLVAIARALASQPRMLLLDEPAAGMMAESVEELSAAIRRLTTEQGITVILVEHHMDLVMRVSDRIAVMHGGSLLTEGGPAYVRAHPEVVSVYLGTGRHAGPAEPTLGD